MLNNVNHNQPYSMPERSHMTPPGAYPYNVQGVRRTPYENNEKGHIYSIRNHSYVYYMFICQNWPKNSKNMMKFFWWFKAGSSTNYCRLTVLKYARTARRLNICTSIGINSKVWAAIFAAHMFIFHNNSLVLRSVWWDLRLWMPLFEI